MRDRASPAANVVEPDTAKLIKQALLFEPFDIAVVIITSALVPETVTVTAGPLLLERSP